VFTALKLEGKEAAMHPGGMAAAAATCKLATGRDTTLCTEHSWLA